MRSIKLLLGAAALAMIAACSDGNVTGGGPTVTGGVVKGPVLGSTVCAFALTGGAKGVAVPLALGVGAAGSISGGCYVTPADGSYNFALPAGTSGDLLIEATGGRFCSNESQVVAGACTGGGTVIDLGGAVMSSIVAVPAAGSNATVYTTPLTTAAVTGGGAGMTSARFNERFNTLAGQVIGAGTPVTPATPPTVANQSYLGTAATALQNGGTLSAVVTALNNGTTTFPGGSGGGGTTPATINAALVNTYNLKFYAGGGEGCSGGTVCPYSEGQDVPVVVNGDGTLSIPGKVLTNPYYRSYGSGPHLPEIIWLDAATNLEYALSDNEGGTFNEINVGDASRPQGPFGTPVFLGQIRTPEVAGNAALQAIAGDYEFERQYAGTNVSWNQVTLSADGAMTFANSGNSTSQTFSASAVTTITSFISCCGRINMKVNVDIDGDGTAGGESDVIYLYVNGSGGLKDVEYGLQSTRKGVSVAPMGQDLETIGSAETNGVAIPDGNVVTGLIDGTTTTLAINTSTASYSSILNLFARDDVTGKKWHITIDQALGLTPANYSCVHGNRVKRIDAAVNMSGDISTNFGGDCNIWVIPEVNSGNIVAITGRFTAEIYTDKRNTRRVVTGAFRYTPP